jgi:hypothetical protein
MLTCITEPAMECEIQHSDANVNNKKEHFKFYKHPRFSDIDHILFSVLI